MSPCTVFVRSAAFAAALDMVSKDVSLVALTCSCPKRRKPMKIQAAHFTAAGIRTAGVKKTRSCSAKEAVCGERCLFFAVLREELRLFSAVLREELRPLPAGECLLFSGVLP